MLEPISEIFTKEMKVADVNKQLDIILTHRRVMFYEQVLALKSHKSIAVRRKLAENIWKLSVELARQSDGDFEAEKLGKIVELNTWQEQEGDRQTWLNLNISKDKISRISEGVKEENDGVREVNVLSVDEAIKSIKKLINDKEYVIEGEISGNKFNYNFASLSLKGSDENRIDCMVFNHTLNRLDFPLNDGLQVRVTGKFNLNKWSKLYFEIKTMKLTGQGELLRNLQLLEKKLDNEGLFDVDRKRKLNPYPVNILLLASTFGAAIDDFIKVLTNRRGGITIYHIPIKTQGSSAEKEIIDSIEYANSIMGLYKIDTVVITRGGGSKDDLFVFNSENVVRAIHSLTRPSIVAIGHEQDFTLAERVADMRASTPSNAAELVSDSNREITGMLDNIEQRAASALATRLNNARIFQQQNERSLVQFYQEFSAKTKEDYKKVVITLEKRLADYRNYIAIQGAKIDSYNPKNIMKMGYIIVKVGNKIVESKVEFEDAMRKQSNENVKTTLQFNDGESDVVVNIL
jgi:exodeoxyribonuclease VII large subunit